MSIFSNIWPFTNLHEINLDWALRKCKEALDKANEALNNARLDSEIVQQLDSRVTAAENVARNASNAANNARTFAEGVNETATAAATRAEQASTTATYAGNMASQALAKSTIYFNYNLDISEADFTYADLLSCINTRPVQIKLSTGGYVRYLDLISYDENTHTITFGKPYYEASTQHMYFWRFAVCLENGETVIYKNPFITSATE